MNWVKIELSCGAAGADTLSAVRDSTYFSVQFYPAFYKAAELSALFALWAVCDCT